MEKRKMVEGYSSLVVIKRVVYFIVGEMALLFVSGLGIGSGFQNNKVYQIFGLVALAMAVPFVYLSSKWMKEVMGHLKGSVGEIRIAGILSLLPPEYRIFNDVIIGDNGNIDHLVVGPTGIWTIETKYIKGHVTLKNGTLNISNRPKKWIGSCTSKAMELKEYVNEKGCEEHWVSAIIVFPGNETIIDLENDTYSKTGVHVISRRALIKLITKEPTKRLGENQIECICDAIERRPAAKS